MHPTSYSLGNTTGGAEQVNRINGMNGVVEKNLNEGMFLTLESLRMEVGKSLREVVRRVLFYVDGVKCGNVKIS